MTSQTHSYDVKKARALTVTVTQVYNSQQTKYRILQLLCYQILTSFVNIYNSC